MRKFILWAAITIIPAGLFAARLTLRDGTVLYGRFVSGTDQSIIFQDDNGARRRTLIGAIAGGSKGAAIGALTGAAAGGGAQVLTRGEEIRVPAETVLNFRLDQPLHLREATY